ncbi:MAG TPA: ACP phosphodiesterase [Bacteroidales bacterium]|nr:ACP phosphodiesterase [Bacteroidales bacterium]HPS16021.1 ACP phosphodiesterase [Bacteroidales bacterium]
MNFLAHLYLSGNNDEIMVGNILADRRRSGGIHHLSEGIQKGIHLHHAIDKFTDKHPVVAESKQRLRAEFRHYSPVIADIYYDHFLAVNWKKYSDESLNDFALKSYKVLKEHRKLFSTGFQVAFIYMRFKNLLVSYATYDGVRFALERMSGRAKNSSNLMNAVDELKKNYTLYKKDFEKFFPEIIAYVNNYRIKQGI